MMRLYHQMLQRFLQKEKRRGKEPLNITVKRKDDNDVTKEDVVEEEKQEDNADQAIENELLDSVSASFKTKARSLLTNLKRNRSKGHLDWTPEGEIVVSGNRVEGSNLVDLIQDSLRSRKGFKDPVGWKTFNEALAMNNTPELLITNTKRRDAMRDRKQPEKGAGTTPTTSKRKGKKRRQSSQQQSPQQKKPWELY